jgi:hypothetical protein
MIDEQRVIAGTLHLCGDCPRDAVPAIRRRIFPGFPEQHLQPKLLLQEMRFFLLDLLPDFPFACSVTPDRGDRLIDLPEPGGQFWLQKEEPLGDGTAVWRCILNSPRTRNPQHWETGDR